MFQPEFDIGIEMPSAENIRPWIPCFGICQCRQFQGYWPLFFTGIL
jgi:hypothetical protein